MAKKEKLPTEITPAGVAAYAWLTKPDTGGEYSDDKYKVTLVLPKKGAPNQAEIDSFIEDINERHAEARGNKKTDSPVKDGDDKDNESFHGHWLITFKSQFQPKCVGKGNKELPENMAVFSGDYVKVAFAAAPYEKGKNAGISMRLNSVKLLEKRNRGGDYGSVFDEDEGVEVDVSGDADDDDSGDY
jgi:hypothetical protein